MSRRALGLVCILLLTGILGCDRPTAAQTPPSTARITPTVTAAATSTPTAAATRASAATPTVAATATDAPTVTPTPKPAAIIYDGEWEGLTALALPVSFTVKNNLLTHFAAEWKTGDCQVTTNPDLPAFGAITRGSFSISSPSGSAFLGFSWHFSGTFTSSSNATGAFSAMLGKCGSVRTTWEAARK